MLQKTEEPLNKYTKAMGELIRKVWKEAGIPQDYLAENICCKRLAVSEMENRKNDNVK